MTTIKIGLNAVKSIGEDVINKAIQIGRVRQLAANGLGDWPSQNEKDLLKYFETEIDFYKAIPAASPVSEPDWDLKIGNDDLGEFMETEHNKEDNAEPVEGFTLGKWEVVEKTKVRATTLEGMLYLADCEVSSFIPQKEAEANARLICETKNMLAFIKRVDAGMESKEWVSYEAKAILNRINNK